MKALTVRDDGYASAMPDDATLSDLAPFVQFEEIDRPSPRAGQVLIAVEMAAVNPSDEMFIQGLYGQPRRAGVPAGFEGVGRVVEAGSGLMGRYLKGKRVSFFATRSGTWGEYAVTDAAACVPVSKDLRAEDAAGFLVNPMTAWAMVDLVEGDAFVMSAAASQLCKFMISLGRDRGLKPIGIVRRGEQVDMLKALGAAAVLDSTATDHAAELKRVCKELKPRTFLDAVTGPGSKQVFDALPDGATWVIYGRLSTEPITIDNAQNFIFRRKTLTGFWLSDWFAKASLLAKTRATRAVQKRFLSGEWTTDVTAVVPLADAMERLPEELAKPGGKVFLKP